MPKRTLKRYDSQPAVTGGGGEAFAAAENIAAPVPAILEAPSGLVATSTEVARSAATPNAYVNLTWFAPNTAVTVTIYEIDVVRFGGVPERYTAYQTSAQIVLDAATQYAFRVRARYDYQVSAWSGAVIITTFADTVVPGVPTSPLLAFIGAGDAVITHTPTTNTNYRDTEIRILSQAGGTLYGTFFDATGRMVWTTAQNKAATSGVGDVSLYVEMRSRSWSNVFSAIVNTGLITKAAPTAPTVTADFSGVNCVYTITPPADAAAVRFVADTAVTARDIGVVGRYVYVFDQNRLDHSGTPDPVLSYSFTALDGLGQASTATTGTATNAAPAAVTSVALSGFVEVLAVNFTYTKPSDFNSYTVRIIKDTVTFATITGETRDIPLYSKNGPGAYQAGVRVVDAFGQVSAETLSVTITLDGVTLSEIRALSQYRDSISTASLDGLKDDNRVADVVSYLADSVWRWTEQINMSAERTQNIVIATGSSPVGYFATSTDGTTYTFFSGPRTGVNADILTLVASEAAAQTAAQTLLADVLWQLPAIREARYVRLYHRKTVVGAYTLREFYAPTLIIADNILSDTIKTRHISAGQVTADRIAVAQLSAIAADMGSITAGTITGAIIRTSAANPRIELDSTALTTYDAGGVVQVQASSATGGKLTAGAGATALDANGVSIVTNTSFSNRDSYKFVDTLGGTVRAAWATYVPIGGPTSILQLNAQIGKPSLLELRSTSAATFSSTITLRAQSTASNNTLLVLSANSSGTYIASLTGQSAAQTEMRIEGALNVGTGITGTGDGTIRASGGMNIGTATGAATGQISATSNLAAASGTTLKNESTNAAAYTSINLLNDSGNSAGLYHNSAANTNYGGAGSLNLATIGAEGMSIVTNNVVRMQFSSAGAIGFFGTPGTVRQTITGSRAGNVALASLLTALAFHGLITDSTT